MSVHRLKNINDEFPDGHEPTDLAARAAMT
jgi:hypothetical protein